MDADGTALAVADALAQSDYKYDPYITVKKDQKRIAIHGTVIAPDADVKKLTPDAKAIAEAVETVRNLGNAPANVMTPAELASRAEEVCKRVGVKYTVFGKREIAKMKMGGLLAVNRGSVEEPRFVVMEYTPKKSKKHVAGRQRHHLRFRRHLHQARGEDGGNEVRHVRRGAVVGVIEAAAKLELPVKIRRSSPRRRTCRAAALTSRARSSR
jgi:hypothetical protein